MLTLLTPAAASADSVRLTNGRILKVDACRFEGDVAVLSMPGGGVIRMPRDLVAEFIADADPEPPGRTAALEALAVSPAASRPRLPAAALRRMVDLVATRVGLDRRLAHAVVHTESNYEPLAVSPRGAMGLMQIMPVLARQYALVDPFDPERNLEAGMRHLHRLLRRFDIRQALAAYNAGETAVARYGGVPPYRETQNYVRRVLTAIR